MADEPSHSGLGRMLAIAVALVASVAVPGRAQLRCEDTQYHVGSRSDPFTSRYHVVQLYGDVSHRSSNFFAEGYDGEVSTTTLRVIYPRLSELVRTRVPLPDLFVGVTASQLTDLAWENRLDAVAGLEWRPLKRTTLPEGPARWLNQLRLYASQYQSAYLRDGSDFAWRPHGDTRVGAELYRECNMFPANSANESLLWAEVWGDVSWRRTNYVEDHFQSWTAAFVPKVGLRFPRGRAAALMLYASGEFSKTQRSEPWQNRMLAGGGVRVMPFRWHEGALTDVLRGARIYVEELWLVKEFNEPVGTLTPKRDVRFGVSFVVNRWQ